MNKQRNNVRGKSGQALAEGACAMLLVSMLIVGGIMLLLNIGMTMYYKQKLSFAALQAAQLAVDERTWNNGLRPALPSDESLEEDTKRRLNSLLKSLGMPKTDDIKVVADTEGVVVKVKISQLALVRSGILPSAIALEETAGALYPKNEPPSLLVIRWPDKDGQIHPERDNNSVMVPVYGRFSLKNSAPDLRRTDARSIATGTAVLRPFTLPHAIFDLHVYNASGNFSDRTPQQARQDRDELLSRLGK